MEPFGASISKSDPTERGTHCPSYIKPEANEENGT